MLDEAAARNPVSRKGGIRVEMEQRLQMAAERGVRSLILRAGDLCETLREVTEMRYLWFNDILLDGTRLHAVLGEEPHTPLDVAVAQTLQRMGCLQTPAVREAARS